MTVSLQTFAASNKDYVARLNNNFSALKAATEALQSAILGSVGAGAQLVTDLFDRGGVVRGYELDEENYDGSEDITITAGVAWGDFNGTFDRVTLAEDLEINASAITSGLPKTVYIVITANGAPQFVESDALPNVVYAWSMTWDGIGYSEFKRLGTLLPGYDLVEDIARRAEIISIFDTETDWLSDEEGKTSIMLPGANTDNELADMVYEVIGFVAQAVRSDEDGFYATEEDPEDTDRDHVKFVVHSEGEDWIDPEDPFDFDCSEGADYQFKPVNPALEASVYITEAQTFELVRTYLGDFVESARAFNWGVVVRRVYGPAMPIDTNFVDGI